MSAEYTGVASSDAPAPGALADAGLNPTGSDPVDFTPPMDPPSTTPETQGDVTPGTTETEGQQPQETAPAQVEETRRTYNRMKDGLNGLGQALLGDEAWEELQSGNPNLDARF